MKFINSVFKSLQTYLPMLISRFSSISKEKPYLQPGTTESKVLKDQKAVADAKKHVKESLYIFIETQYSLLFANDVKYIKDNNVHVNITPTQYENLVSRIYADSRPLLECFLQEKKMSLTICKYFAIVISGYLIDILIEMENEKE